MIFFVQVSSLINRLILDFHCCVFSFLFVIHFVSSLFPGMSFVFECYYSLGDNVCITSKIPSVCADLVVE